ncbi:MAG: hypothetical protein DIU80_004160 [Chloroflexota bacterium]|nr:MAG: hypothetical protein DIU80_02475 [Chloroflexota bacterium]
MAQSIFERFVRLPRLIQLGVLVLAIGVALDLLAHAAPPAWSVQLSGFLGADGSRAHVVTLLGMVLTVAGIFARGAGARGAREEAGPEAGRSAIDQ